MNTVGETFNISIRDVQHPKEPAMLLVHTSEIEASFVGFPITVSLDDECTCEGNSGCSSCNVARLTFHAHEREDGACEQWLNFEASRDDMARVLREALALIEGTPAA